VVRGRCRSSNLCDFCAKLAAVETAEVLALDALESGRAPSVWAVLTTTSTSTKPADFYESRRQLLRALRRRWPDVEYAALVEFTTGYGPKSGGRRRPHWNLLLKGISVEEVDQVRDVINAVWCPRVNAKPAGQHVGPVAEVGGLMRYLALHFQKQSQRPPRGWSGHRFMTSRGYFAEPIGPLRDRARDQLQYRREIWKLNRDAAAAGVELLPDEVLELAELAHQVGRAETWELVRVQQTTGAPRPARRIPTARLADAPAPASARPDARPRARADRAPRRAAPSCSDGDEPPGVAACGTVRGSQRDEQMGQ
jgi:hypothetical protein